MKIYVIDNIGLIPPQLLMAEADVSFFTDEIRAMNAVEAELPGLILLNHAVRESETPGYIDLLLTISPETRIVLIGNDLSDNSVLDCLFAGAKGYQHSGNLPEYIDKIIKVVSVGEAWITRRMTARLLEAFRRRSQVEVSGLLAQGVNTFSNAEVRV